MSNKRFRIAFSFAGEKRDYVAEVAGILAHQFGKEAILYDKYHEAEFAQPDLGMMLPNLYHDESYLVVVVVCPDYDKKEWPGLEWRAIHDLIKIRRDNEVMLCRFGHAKLKGIFSTAGWMELDEKTAEETAGLILERLAIVEGKSKEFYIRHSGTRADGDAAGSKGEAISFLEDGAHFEEPSIIWRLPRGFILLSDIVKKKFSSWATVAEYYSYDGTWRQGTHYHESYAWDRVPGGIENQCHKLQVPRGDWCFARAPIYLMMKIREENVRVKSTGEFEGNELLDSSLATIHPPGAVPLPTVPISYRGMSVSGELRDLAANAIEFSKRNTSALLVDAEWERYEEPIKELRREARIAIHQLLPDTHPAAKNLVEVIEAFSLDRFTLKRWLRELAGALWEAATCVEELQEAVK